MNIKNKILLLFFATIITLTVVLFLFRKTQQRQNDMIIQSAAEQQVVLINTAINVQSDQLDQIVIDYTNWDEIIVNIKNPNLKWAEDNIASIVKSFKLYSVDIYNADNQLIYSFGKQSTDIQGNSSTRGLIINAMREKGIMHFFRLIPDGLLEISASSIHPTLDSLRTTPPAGYFFISRIWNQRFLHELAENTASSIYFAERIIPKNQLIENDSITVSKALMSFDEKIIGNLVIKKPNNVLVNYHNISNFVFYFLGGSLLFLLTLFFIILYRWIRRPLKIISESLRHGDTSQLEKLEKQKNEFSQIARLISIFNQQKLELEKENIEINLVQAELIKQRSVLHGMALASNYLLTNEDFDSAIREALNAISTPSALDRIFIYKNVIDNPSGDKKAKRVYEYIKPALKDKIDSKKCEEISTTQKDGWYTSLMEGHTIKGLSGELTSDLKPLIDCQLIKSILIEPIINQKKNHFWGFVGFADCTHDHTWNAAEETVLSMLASNIGGAIRRQQSQEELKEAMELAKSADRAKSEFLASMSHEIRTPMNGVIGMTSLLQLSELTPTQRDYVNTIETSGESLMNIINEILDFSKIESGRMELEENSFDLRLCIEDVLDLMAPKALEKHLDIIYFIDPDVHQYIFGDGFRLRQIIVNLVSNAIKFTEKGDILIYVSLVSQTEEKVVLEFSVKDTGIGIPASKIDLLFSPFMQVDASTTRKYGGTGLGLAITSSLVKLMHGKIGVVSEEGRGSDFHFTIQTRNSTPKEEFNNLDKTLRYLSGKSILIVDDNATNRKILTLQCEHWGIKTTTAESGEEALILLKEHRYDVAILDMQMPQMDGIMLAHKIREQFNKEQMPLVMLTSVGFNKESDELRKLFSFYVNKPIKHSQLANILLSIMKPAKAQTVIEPTNYEKLKEISKAYPFQILIAEDNQINQKIIRNIFEILGYKTDIAANGIEALEALKRKSYNLVFMDIQMPEMNGYEATKIIIQRWKEDRPIIIAMTANAMQGDKEKCLEAGMDDYISKPMKIDDLVKVIKIWGNKQFPVTT